MARTGALAAAAGRRRHVALEQRARGADRRDRTATARRGPPVPATASWSRRRARRASSIAYVAALRAGLVVVPLNTAYTSAEVARIVAEARPAAAAVDNDERARWINAAAVDPVRVLGMEIDLPDGGDEPIDLADGGRAGAARLHLRYHRAAEGCPPDARQPAFERHRGEPRLAVGARRPPAPDVAALPPARARRGGQREPLRRRDPLPAAEVRPGRRDLAVCRRRGDRSSSACPTMYQRLAASGRADALAALRLLVSGSAPLPASLALAIAEQAGQLPLERYGMTETVMLTTNPYDGPRKPGTVGFPFPGVEVRLGRAERGRGPRTERDLGYYDQNPEATAEAFTADGWFRTGDLGEFDADGYLRLVGRSKDLIITGGYNVHPREVEEALLTHPASARWL